MKKQDFLKEIRELSEEALLQKERDIAEELMRLRFRKAGGQLEQGHLIGELKQNRARILSVIKEKRAQAAA
jgi:ribosomal protein L29